MVTITLKSNIDEKTAKEASTKEIEFDVVAKGESVKQKSNGSVKQEEGKTAAAAPSAQFAAVVLGALLALA